MAFPDFKNEYVLLDGAFGTMLQKMILPKAEIPELYNLVAPEAVKSIHKAYADAGSQILYANTFGANPFKFENLPYSMEEVIANGIRLAKEAGKETGAAVALDIGPSGQLLEPMGTLPFEEAVEAFARMVRAGVKAGADLIVIETMTDLYEAKAALLAAKENSDLPVLVTMSFEENGRTFTGCSIESMVLTLESLGADAIGLNCSLGPVQLAGLLEKLCQISHLPIIAKPNAGLPDPISGHYHLSPEEFGEAAKAYIDAGVTILGGCCGTTPETIRVLHDLVQNRKPPERHPEERHGIASPVRAVYTDEIRVIGERINPTGKKRFAKALLEEDLDYIARMALDQKEAGAEILDVNVGYPGVDEVKMMPLVVKKIQSVTDLPLLLDSSSPEALRAGLRVVNGKAAINSVNAKQESMDAIFPIAKKYGACLVGLCMDEAGIPSSAEGRLEAAHEIIKEAEKYGISSQDLWVDCLTLTVSAQQDQAQETLKAVRMISEELKIPTVLGVSNISFGLPLRSLMTQTFLSAALQSGLRLAIINPNAENLMDTVTAFRVLNNQDPDSRNYVTRFSGRKEMTPSSVQTNTPAAVQNSPDQSPLCAAIAKGLDQEAAALAKELLSSGTEELEVAEKHLIPALDQVGQDYEKGILYLPQLLAAASSAQAVFEVIRQSMAAKGAGSLKKGKIVLATVQGDIHDIGKNIVKTLLENYGYEVIDLGRDVPPEKVLEAVLEEDAPMVGLSALMTTTLPSMKKTIELLHTLENPPKIMVGGAVLTKEAAEEMKADYYCRDARESVAAARDVFGQ